MRGAILDGRNRYRACQVADAPIKTVDWAGESSVAYVLSMNLHRRHLTDDQRASVALAVAPMIEAETERIRRAKISTARSGEAETGVNSPQSQPDPRAGHPSHRALAEQFKVSEHKIRQAKEIAAADIGGAP